MELQERPPLKPNDGTPLRPWKTDTHLRKALFDLSEFVPVMLTIERVLKQDNPGISWGCWTWHKYIDITPTNDEHARRIVGKLIRAFRAQPEIVKPTDDTMESRWKIEGVDVTVKGYKPKTCRYEEVEVEVPEQEARIETIHHEAVPAHTKMKRVLVCDDVAPEPATATEEVPF